MKTKSPVIRLLIATYFSLWIISESCEENPQPVIGILAQTTNPDSSYSNTSYIAASYVKFVEMFGARAVPVLPHQTDAYYKGL